MNLVYLAKVPALAMIMGAEYISFWPPNPSPKDAGRRKFDSAFYAALARWYPPLGVTVNSSLRLCEVVAVLARAFPSPLSDRILSMLFKHPANADTLTISPTFVVGVLLLILGAAGRKMCYDTLGKFFTFQLAVHKEHTLITTGPYAIVRHPSYTAFLLTDIGCLMTLLLPGSYVHECGMLRTSWGPIFAALWGMAHVGLMISVVRRVPVEDAVLREEFGRGWDAWARRTPYALVPYVY